MSKSPQPKNEMKMADRSDFAREWLEDARVQQENRKVFSAFFSGYVALVACATQIAADEGAFRTYANQPDELLEREAIEFAMKAYSVGINKFITSAEGARVTGLMRSREVPEGDEFKMIGSVNDPELTEAASHLYSLWSPLAVATKSGEDVTSQAANLAIVFRKVRNRLFHGGKMCDPHGTDADLLERLNQVLFGVVEKLIVH